MDDMVERVLSLCPECDPIDVERDLNITGDVEWTLNRALDGLLSPRSLSVGSQNKTNPLNSVTIVMDDDDDDHDVVVMPSPKFTTLKEKSGPDTDQITSNTKFILSVETTATSNTKKQNSNLSFELSDSEQIDTSEMCRQTLQKLKASLTNLEASTSSTVKDITSAQSNPSSPDSDTELLRPIFYYNQGDNSVGMTSKPHCSSESVTDLNKDSHIAAYSDKINSVAKPRIQDFRKKIETVTVNIDVCSEEPVRKKKRTKVEVDERKREAMLKKAAKEKERQEKLEEKQRQKESRQAVLHEKKLQKEKDQLQRKAQRLTKSVNKLDGCLKFMTAYLDPALFSDEVATPDTNLILQKLSSMEANYAIAPQPYPGSVTWQRTTVQHSVQDHIHGELQITTSDRRKEEIEVLVVLSADQFAEVIYSFKQGYVGGNESLEERPETLVDFTKHVKNIYRGKKVTFLVSGLEKYMRNVKLKQQRAFRNAAVGEAAEEETTRGNGTRKRRKKKTLAVLDVTRTDIEEALVDLQIKTNVCVYHCETDEDLALKIAVFTKAVAERPFKKSLTDGIGFCLDRLVKTSLKVSKDGQGMVNVWQQQIQQFRNVSREMAAAIVAEYPSPQLLKQSYEECYSVQDAMLLLQDILVRRGGGSLATSRRIGPELSKRFYILFHSKDNGDLVKG